MKLNKIALVFTTVILLSGCQPDPVPEKEMVEVEAEFVSPDTGEVEKRKLLVEKKKVYSDTIEDWNNRSREEKGNIYFFCNGGMLWAYRDKGHGAYSYPVVDSMFNGYQPKYKQCDVETGEIK